MKDKIQISILTAIFILMNLPPDITRISSFKNVVLAFGYILGECILAGLAGVIIAAILMTGLVRLGKKHIGSSDTVKLILICSIAASILLNVKKYGL